jgi:hypothetical protein|tara:strand:+ start:596 stop:814 length:219 start_codon:yes stop_codon:yes gene_type:complete
MVVYKKIKHQSTIKKNQMISNWLSSKETQKALKITGCALMHLRQSGKLRFKKQGNAYFYQINKIKPDANEIC